jgi:A/G-specific adenine glycosylase
MELGETICLPGTPDCQLCPLQALCLGYKTGRQTDFPVMPEKKPRKIQPKTVFILAHEGCHALRKRPDTGLLAGLWEFPNVDGALTPTQALEQAAAWGCEPISAEPCGDRVHIFTHLEWHMTGYCILCRQAPDRFVWVDAAQRQEKYALPTAFRGYARAT